MVPNPLFYQPLVVALVLICLLLHVGLPDMPLPKPQQGAGTRPPDPHFEKRLAYCTFEQYNASLCSRGMRVSAPDSPGKERKAMTLESLGPLVDALCAVLHGKGCTVREISVTYSPLAAEEAPHGDSSSRVDGSGTQPPPWGSGREDRSIPA